MNKLSSKRIKSTFVLGSTSTVAKAICIELAKKHNCERFHLVARKPDDNLELINKLENSYNSFVTQEKADLIDSSNIQNLIVPTIANFDLYLITAGSLGEPHLAREDPKKALEITASNYSGIIPWITSIASEERLSRPGKLWIFSSVAADKGRPSNYHYGAAKAGLTTLCEGLFLRCERKPFAIRIIKAGYIDSPMTQGKVPKFICANTKDIAKSLLRRPDRRGIEYIPWWWNLIMSIIKILPHSLTSKL